MEATEDCNPVYPVIPLNLAEPVLGVDEAGANGSGVGGNNDNDM